MLPRYVYGLNVETHLHRDAHYSTLSTVIVRRDLPRYSDPIQYNFVVVQITPHSIIEGQIQFS